MTDAAHLPNDPNPDADPLEERLREEAAPLFRELAQLEEAAVDLPERVDDQATADSMTALAGRMKALGKRFEAARVAAKEPFLRGSLTVDNTLGSPKKTMDDRAKVVMSRVNAHHDRVAEETRRRAAEEAERLRWEAEEQRRAADHAAALESHQEADMRHQEAAQTDAQADAQDKKAATTKTATTKTDGATGYQVTRRAFRITDPQLFRDSFGPMKDYLDKDSVAAALGRAAKADPWPTIPGVEFFTHTETRVRSTGA